MRAAGDILLVSTYELGHQPLHLASPLAFLERDGYRPRAVDVSVEPLDDEAIRRARFVAVAVPMHTALRLGAEVGARVKALNPTAHLCYFGLYAPLNREYLRQHGADSVLGGEYEAALVAVVRAAELVKPIAVLVAAVAAALPVAPEPAHASEIGAAELVKPISALVEPIPGRAGAAPPIAASEIGAAELVKPIVAMVEPIPTARVSSGPPIPGGESGAAELVKPLAGERTTAVRSAATGTVGGIELGEPCAAGRSDDAGSAEKAADRPGELVKPISEMVEPIVLERLDFPVPSRARLPLLSRYARLEVDGEARLAGYAEASRGCLHHCRHCPIPPVYEGRFFVVPIETVVADVAQQVAAGARHVTLGDPDFFNGPGHAMAVARAIHAAHPSLTFDVTIKVEHILRRRALFGELATLGCAFVVSAVESTSDTVLRLLDKGHTRADLDEALAILDAAGLPLRPTWLPFTPWTTLDDYLDMLDWIESHAMIDHVDLVQLAVRLLIPPGSKLLSLPEMQAVLGPLEPEKLSYAWTHPDPRMDRLAHDVFSAVAEGAHFADVRALARAAAALPQLSTTAIVHKRVRGRPPRLSESWFC